MRTLVYVVGTNYSGTTLLSSILGCHPHIESLGQLFEIEEYQHNARKCMCGAAVPDCPFWSRVLPESGFWHQGRRTLERCPTEFRYGGLLHRRFGLVRPRAPDNVAAFRAFTLRLLDAASRASDRNILVDSSKSPHRLEWLVRSAVDREVNLRVLRVTRSGLGVMRSYMKRGQSAARGALAYRHRNAQVEAVVRRHAADRTMALSYEALCSHPRKTMELVCAHIGVPFDARMLDFRSRVQHQVGGNPMRFRDETEIRLDEAYRTELSLAARLAFRILGGPERPPSSQGH